MRDSTFNIRAAGRRSALCFIDRLPFELISIIFTIGQESYGEEWRQQAYGGYALFQAVICCVSKHWRDVAIATPALWTRLRVIGPRTAYHAAGCAWRSGARDLDVGLMVTRPADMTLALDLLGPYFHRITALTLDVRSKLGSARDIEIRFLPMILRRLRCSQVYFECPVKLRAALSSCEQLTSLDLSTCFGSAPMGSMGEQEIHRARTRWFTLPFLEEMMLPANSLAEHIRRFLVAPNVKHVSIHGGPWFFPRAFPPSDPNTLQVTLPWAITERFRTKDAFLELLPLFPEVRVLTLEVNSFDPEHSLAQALLDLSEPKTGYPLPSLLSPTAVFTWVSAPQVLLPHLHTIHILNLDHSPKAAFQFLFDRQLWSPYGRPDVAERPCPLEKIVVSSSQRGPMEWEESVAELKRLGVKIEEDFN